jgi:hypothetical protein
MLMLLPWVFLLFYCTVIFPYIAGLYLNGCDTLRIIPAQGGWIIHQLVINVQR